MVCFFVCLLRPIGCCNTQHLSMHILQQFRSFTYTSHSSLSSCCSCRLGSRAKQRPQLLPRTLQHGREHFRAVFLLLLFRAVGFCGEDAPTQGYSSCQTACHLTGLSPRELTRLSHPPKQPTRGIKSDLH